LPKQHGDRNPFKPLSNAERAAHEAFRQPKVDAVVSDQQAEQTAFNDNRERLKTERLAREALEPAKKRKKPSA
jgi:hypothetical protein